MKLLVAYDGSKCAEAAIDDLLLAGLPEDADAMVLSVAEVWLPPQDAEQNVSIALDSHTMAQIRKHWEKGRRAVGEAEVFAKHAQSRIRKIFPRWHVEAESTYGSPAWEILQKADEIKPDLIVVGSHGRTALGRFFLGSISQKVLTEARVSVRVARGKIEVDPAPSRIIIGFDGSKGATAAVESVARRVWREYSEVRLIAVTDPVTPSAIGRFVPPVVSWTDETNASERRWMENLADEALQKLENAGLKASLSIIAGNPKHVLVEEAEHWHADSIFVGANALGGAFERFLLGSVSAAVAARAHCSVEVVRMNQ
jgi:nucleotide-binding universal stress UspA family protein